MCVPIAVAAGIVQATGALVSGGQGMMQSSYESRLARQNAALETERAHDSIARGREEASDFFRQAGQLKGQQVASMAANNVDVGEGTPLLMRQDTEAGVSEDAGRLYRNIHERTRGFDINASNYRSEALAAKSRGRAALITSAFQAGSSLMSGFTQQRTMRARLGITGG